MKKLAILIFGLFLLNSCKKEAQTQTAVSYTHLDVYKRQHQYVETWCLCMGTDTEQYAD